MEARLPIRTVQDNPVYAGLVESMDDAVGVVLVRLKELGLDDNTIIVFTSDNGGVASGDAFSTSNFPLRGGKGYQWEGGIREPYLIKAPMIKNTPKTIDYPVSGIDLYPTLLDMVGAAKDPKQVVDGISLLPLLEGKSLDNRPLFWHYPHYGNQGGDPVSMIRKENYKLIHYWEDGHDELYDLEEDMGEENDISKEQTDITQSLRNELDTYLSSVNANTPKAYPKYDEAKAAQTQNKRKTEMLSRLEKQRKDFLDKDFQPNEDWYNSNLTKD
jgi:arylsulfatase A-like enzyme